LGNRFTSSGVIVDAVIRTITTSVEESWNRTYAIYRACNEYF